MSKSAAGILGDIVIAYETLMRECADEDRDFLHHLAHLTVHGYLHLVGYDHQNDAEASEMEALESKIMTRMKLPDPWQDLDCKSGGA
jgi:probable rRNA maturation factor